MLRRLRGDPRPYIVLVIAVAIIGAFFVVVAPLFATSGSATADLGGVLPTSAKLGQNLEVDVGYDNTSSAVIESTCVLVATNGPLQVSSVTFQGLDVERVINGKACGGSLNGQETISVRIVCVPTAAGMASLSITPANGNTAVGAGLAGRITIAPS